MTVVASERDAAERAVWRDEAAGFAAAALVVGAERRTTRAMTPRRARAPRGVRAVGSALRHHGPTGTLLAARTPAGIGAALVVAGGVDGAALVADLRGVLVPTLRPGQVVVWANFAVHTDARARALVAAAGCRLLVPSPDVTPIEFAFAQRKDRLRRSAARTDDALVAAIGVALDTITAADARAVFATCSFPLPGQLL